MSATVQIRPLEPHDRADVKRLHARCFSEGMALDELVLENLMTHPYGVNLVALEDDTLLGFAGAIHGAHPKGRLLTLHVDPNARRLGIARQLLETLETRLQARKAQHLDLEVHAENEAALSLYKETGFETVRENEQAYPSVDPSTGYVMRKDLSNA